jgi:hypothetical protein
VTVTNDALQRVSRAKPTCLGCGKPLVRSPRKGGRERETCSDACRKRVWRWRQGIKFGWAPRLTEELDTPFKRHEKEQEARIELVLAQSHIAAVEAENAVLKSRIEHLEAEVARLQVLVDYHEKRKR